MTEYSAAKAIEILLVEDNPGDVRLAKEALSESKIHNQVNVVTNGEDAISYLKKENHFANVARPDIVLLDLNLPKKSGREVLSEMKNDPELRRIPVVILTTSKAEEDIFRTYDLHANCYITKPVDMDQFISIVKVLQDFWFTIVRLPKQ